MDAESTGKDTRLPPEDESRAMPLGGNAKVRTLA